MLFVGSLPELSRFFVRLQSDFFANYDSLPRS
jgi:hypothetical protein